MAQQRQQQPTASSPPSSSLTHSTSSASSSSHSHAHAQAQYAEYTPAALQHQHQLRSPGTPGTPLHMQREDTRLLASQPTSPALPTHEFGALGAIAMGLGSGPVRNNSLGALASPQAQQQLFAPQAQGPGLAATPNPFATPNSTISVSRVGSVTPNTPSRPVSRGSVAPFPAYNVSNPQPQHHSPHSHSHSHYHPTSASASAPTSPMRFGPGAAAGGGVLADESVFATLGLGPNSSGFPTSMGAKGAGSMVLYRLADSSSSTSKDKDKDGVLVPPRFPGSPNGSNAPSPSPSLLNAHSGTHRNSYSSTADAESILSVAESKYPLTGVGYGGGGRPFSGATGASMGTTSSVRGLIPYVYDPMLDEAEPLDEEDLLHDPNPRAWDSGRYDALKASRGHPPSSSSSSSSKLTSKRPHHPGSSSSSEKHRNSKHPNPQRTKSTFEKTHFPWRGILNIGIKRGMRGLRGM
ncbi:hypothetical protein JR316_0011915 [Psilocybe cubensis]|uniref:Uncharacterized protein n=1 Tax=Psilocybe cubensis TaxID=181762 RepID=A0ACB8GLJ9_PSICU|nr:hypothetical protein JR316_0011915 [Psilocybe cubensis]KAH9476340.1 hypothetical protein JR316_0011915 [Psilocybe cubensis]